MKVLVIREGNKKEIIEIENSLEAQQKLVGGYIECPFIDRRMSQMGILLVCNEEGMLKGFEPTLAIVKDGEVAGCILGTTFFCGIDGANVAGLNDEQIQFLEDSLDSNLVYTGDEEVKKFPIMAYII